MTPADIVQFWTDAGPKRWFAKDDQFDTSIRERFEAAHHAAARRGLDDWAETAEGSLALLLLLDQFPRNMYRGSAHAFATDPLARLIAAKAIAASHDKAVEPALADFFRLPFKHSESLEDQDRAVALSQASGDSGAIKWATLHRDIIRRFGRFPHRNAALARETTAEEAAFVRSGGFAG